MAKANSKKGNPETENTGGVMFVLANPAMADYVKVGYSTDLTARVKEMDTAGTSPFPWECLYAAEVDNPGAWVRMVREVMASAKVSTCFFQSRVTEEIIGVFRLAKGKEVTPATAKKSRGRVKTASESKKAKKANFDFEMLGLEVGDELQFAGEGSEAVCRVIGVKPPRVDLNGEYISLSVAAAKVLGRDSTKGVQGPRWWRYGEEMLSDRRRRLESAE